MYDIMHIKSMIIMLGMGRRIVIIFMHFWFEFIVYIIENVPIIPPMK